VPTLSHFFLDNDDDTTKTLNIIWGNWDYSDDDDDDDTTTTTTTTEPSATTAIDSSSVGSS